jgi:hypothetical protein
MLEHYLATLLRLGQPRDLSHSALPDDQELDTWEAEHGWLYR